MSDSSGKLKLGALVALVVGSMIGGGIFSLPQNMAASAGVGAVLIGWGITAVGMLTLAFVFQTLANRTPDPCQCAGATSAALYGATPCQLRCARHPC